MYCMCVSPHIERISGAYVHVMCGLLGPLAEQMFDIIVGSLSLSFPSHHIMILE